MAAPLPPRPHRLTPQRNFPSPKMRRFDRTPPRIYSGTDQSSPVSNILMFSSNYTLWEILKSLSTLQQLFCLILVVVSIYSLLSATVILVRLRSLTNRTNFEDIPSLHPSLPPFPP